ncbi:Ferripyoverdine receptor precursor [compost metagenome]
MFSPKPFKPCRALTLAVHFALGAVPLLAAQPLQAQQQIKRYDIPGGPLGDVLSRFARESGLAISFNAGQVAGLASAGLQGSYAVQEGFAQVLRGHALQAQASSDGYVLVEVPAANGALELGATSINGQMLGSITEDSGSYTTGPMQTATKLPLTIRETPQSVTVITRQRMDDQNLRSLEDVLKSTPGMSMTKDGPQRPTFYARGFTVENLMNDGLSNDLSHYLSRDMNSAPDMAIYDHVEVVRGATGLMQGAGTPSAAINMVRKRPTADPRVSITASAGSWDNYRSEVDASGPLNDNATLRGRVVTAYQTRNSFQDVTDSERSVFYAIGEADLSDNSTLTLGVSNQRVNNTATWGGLPTAIDGSDLHLSRKTYLGNDWEYWDQDNTTVFSRLDYRFDNDWKLLLAASRTWSDLKMLGSMTERMGDGGEVFGQYLGQYHYDDEQSSYDAYASGPFQLLGRTHELVVGASRRELTFEGKGNYSDDAIGMDIYNWDPGSLPKRELDLSYWHQDRETSQTGAYLTTRFNLADDLKLILGGRLDWYDNDTSTRNGSRAPTGSDYSVTRHVTRYAGIIYDLDVHHSLYASYTDIFKPQSELDAAGTAIEPMEGKNYELGIKGEYFDGSLNASAAVFRIDQQNRAKTLELNECSALVPSCAEAAGKLRSEGIELELNGTVLPGWELGAGYTFAQVKYVKDSNPANEGRLFDTDIPRHVFKAFTTYQLPGELQRWKVGGGLYRQNQIYNKGNNFYATESRYRIEQEAYTLVDLMLNYQASEHLDVRLNLNNVFDKKYYQSIAGNTGYGGNLYGDPRNFMLTTRWSF